MSDVARVQEAADLLGRLIRERKVLVDAEPVLQTLLVAETQLAATQDKLERTTRALEELLARQATAERRMAELDSAWEQKKAKIAQEEADALFCIAANIQGAKKREAVALEAADAAERTFNRTKTRLKAEHDQLMADHKRAVEEAQPVLDAMIADRKQRLAELDAKLAEMVLALTAQRKGAVDG